MCIHVECMSGREKDVRPTHEMVKGNKKFPFEYDEE